MNMAKNQENMAKQSLVDAKELNARLMQERSTNNPSFNKKRKEHYRNEF